MPGISYIPQGESSFDRAVRSIGMISQIANETQRLQMANRRLASSLQSEELQRQNLAQEMAFRKLYEPQEADAKLGQIQAQTGQIQAQTNLIGQETQTSFNQMQMSQLQQNELSNPNSRTNRLADSQIAAQRASMAANEAETGFAQTKNKAAEFSLDELKAGAQGLPDAIKAMGKLNGITDPRQLDVLANVHGPEAAQTYHELVQGYTRQQEINLQLQAHDQQQNIRSFFSLIQSGNPAAAAPLADSLPAGLGHKIINAYEAKPTEKDKNLELARDLFSQGTQSGDPNQTLAGIEIAAKATGYTIPKRQVTTEETNRGDFGQGGYKPDLVAAAAALTPILSQSKAAKNAGVKTVDEPAPVEKPSPIKETINGGGQSSQQNGFAPAFTRITQDGEGGKSFKLTSTGKTYNAKVVNSESLPVVPVSDWNDVPRGTKVLLITPGLPNGTVVTKQ